MPAFIRSLRVESADAVAHAGHVLMGQLFRFHGQPVQRSRHDDERPVPALRGALAEGLVKLKQFPEGRPTAHVHDARIILRSLGRKAVRAISLQLVGKISAGDIRGPAAGFFHSPLDDLPQPVMLFQRQAGQPQPDQPEIIILLPDEIQRHHRAVIQCLFPLAHRARGKAVFLC